MTFIIIKMWMLSIYYFCFYFKNLIQCFFSHLPSAEWWLADWLRVIHLAQVGCGQRRVQDHGEGILCMGGWIQTCRQSFQPGQDFQVRTSCALYLSTSVSMDMTFVWEPHVQGFKLWWKEDLSWEIKLFSQSHFLFFCLFCFDCYSWVFVSLKKKKNK